MKLDKILLLGDERLYMNSAPVEPGELGLLMPAIRELHELVLEYRSVYGSGRAIAAPQIGVLKRIICLNIDRPIVMINPVVSERSNEMFELWDDCMSFPNLFVKVIRHKRLTLSFYDENWEKQTWNLEDDMAELIQHEYDHLDGILATQRAIDEKSFRYVE